MNQSSFKMSLQKSHSGISQATNEEQKEQLIKRNVIRTELVLRFRLIVALSKFRKILKQIKERDEKEKKEEKEKATANIFSLGTFFGGKAKKPKEKDMEVYKYWNLPESAIPCDHLDEEMKIATIILIQCKIRAWLAYRPPDLKSEAYKSAMLKSVTVCQSAIRRFLVSTKVQQDIAKRHEDHKYFDELCFLLADSGIDIIMFSKKYGTMKQRKFKFDKDRRYIVYETSKMSKVFSMNKLEVRSFYNITKGISGYRYSTKPKALGRCFSIHLTGGKCKDFQAIDVDQFNMLWSGLSRLIQYMNGQSPFYVDETGKPRRAGPSIIKYAIDRHLRKLPLDKQEKFNLKVALEQSGLLNEQDLENMKKFQEGISQMDTLGVLNKEAEAKAEEAKEAEAQEAQRYFLLSVADRQRFKRALEALAEEYARWDEEAKREELLRAQEMNQPSRDLRDLESDTHKTPATAGAGSGKVANSTSNTNISGSNQPKTHTLQRQLYTSSASLSSSKLDSNDEEDDDEDGEKKAYHMEVYPQLGSADSEDQRPALSVHTSASGRRWEVRDVDDAGSNSSSQPGGSKDKGKSRSRSR